MKIYSWNVNGLRAVARKGFSDIVADLNPDILCVQETKMQDDQYTTALTEIGDYTVYTNSAEKKGYSGVATYTKQQPLKVTRGIEQKEFDDEGRVLTLEFENVYVVNVYIPNSQPGLKRLEFRKQFNDAFTAYLAQLKENKEVVVCGDLNVAHNEIDLKNPKNNKNNPGFFIEEREKFGSLLDSGFVDTFRHLYPDTVKYSWWSYRFNARAKNIGWRIDYVLISSSALDKLSNAFIRNDIYGSDHCPVGIDIDL